MSDKRTGKKAKSVRAITPEKDAAAPVVSDVTRSPAMKDRRK